MGAAATHMWEQAAAAWAEVDPEAAERLGADDDELDVVAHEVSETLGQSGELGWTPVMECRLVVRFYERLGDHAVHVCDRIRWWATAT
jgi:phosphate transport system protein